MQWGPFLVLLATYLPKGKMNYSDHKKLYFGFSNFVVALISKSIIVKATIKYNFTS